VQRDLGIEPGSLSSSAAGSGATTASSGGTTSASSTSSTAPCPPDRMPACDGSPCSVALFEPSSEKPRQVLVGVDAIYWVSGGSVVKRITFADPSATQVVARGAILDVAIDATRSYWTDASDGGVYSAPLDGTLLPSLVAQTPAPIDGGADPRIAVANGKVYFASQGALWRAAADGTQAANPDRIASLSGVGANPLQDLAADDAYVYWTDQANILRMKLADIGNPSATVETFASSTHPATPKAIALDVDTVYWLDTSVHWQPKAAGADGGGAQPLNMFDPPAGIAVDEAHVYWATSGGNLGFLDKDGGSPTAMFVTLPPGPKNIAVDCGALYVAVRSNATTDGIYKVAKPP
jgi:hypothetical protein